MRLKRMMMSLLVPAALGAGATPAFASPITGFEAPAFTVGNIAGQNGWNVFGPGLATVENFFAKTGSQAVFIDGNTSAQSGPYTPVSGGSLVELAADIAIFTSSTQTSWQFAGLGPGLIQFLGGINISSVGPVSQIFAITPGGGPAIGTFARATAFDATAWHHISLVFDMNAQKYSVTLDGTTLATNLAFCGGNATCTGAPVSTFGSAIFDSFGGNGNDSAYMDNFSVADVNAVPEPATLLLLATGLGAGLRRRFQRT